MIWVGFATGFGSIFSTVLWIQIRILQNETDPGGSGSGSKTPIQTHIKKCDLKTFHTFIKIKNQFYRTF